MERYLPKPKRKLASAFPWSFFRRGVQSLLNRQRFEQFIHFAAAIGKRLKLNSGFVEQRQMEIGQRRRFGVLDMASAFHSSSQPARDQDWEIGMVVDVGIADPAAIKVKRMIEEGAIAFRG